MNVKTIVVLITSAIVSLLLLTTVVVPIIESGSQTLGEEEQNVGYNFSSYKDNETFTLEHVTGSTNLINGVSRDLREEFSGTVWIISEEVCIRIGSDVRTSFICTGYSNTLVAGDTITFSNGTVVIDTENFDGEYSYSRLYVPDLNGTYGGFYNVPVKVDKSQDVFIFKTGMSGDAHWTGVYNIYYGFRLTSPIVFVVAGQPNTAYGGTFELDVTPTDIGVSYTLSPSNVIGHYVMEDGTEINNTTDRFFIAPITYHVAEDNDGVVYTLLSILPVFVVIGIAIGVISYMRRT